MKKLLIVLPLILIVFFATYLMQSRQIQNTAINKPDDKTIDYEKSKQLAKQLKRTRPSDWFFEQRAYPFNTIPQAQHREAVLEAKDMRRAYAALKSSEAVVWEEAGPYNVPGRICDIAVHPDYPNTMYIASSSGGVFKSADLGVTFTAIFDDEGAPSIGAIAVDPSDPDIIYVGTGEPNPRNSSYEGDGLYKSTDGGDTWTHIGLANSYRIGRIIVDPDYPDTVYVAAVGTYWGAAHPERGVYRSQDGGATWEQLLYINDNTGCIDIALHADSGVLLAAMWEVRSGPGSGIWRSPDRGTTWNNLTGTNGLPAGGELARMAVTFGKDHNTAYAIMSTSTAMPTEFNDSYVTDIVRSDDLGLNWTATNTSSLLPNLANGRIWYFCNIRVSPTNPEHVYMLDFDLWESKNGGDSWFNITTGNPSGDPDEYPHVDMHAMCILENNDSVFYLGHDGGVSYSDDEGNTWTNFRNMPNTEFYAIAQDYLLPERLYGGAQDNGTSGTKTGGLGDWVHILGGDGFCCLVDYTNSDIVYAEWQYGNFCKSYNGGEFFYYLINGISTTENRGWLTPVVMDPNNHNVLYYGAQSVYKTTNGAVYWEVYGYPFTSAYITAIGVARSDELVVYAGSADGNVAVSIDGGVSLINISAGLPNRFVTRLTVDPYSANICYITHSGYRQDGTTLPHIHRTTDYGQTWTDISGNLPDVPINDCIVDPYNNMILYVATDVGVFRTTDLGVNWSPLGTGMPLVAVHDLEYHYPTKTLVAGTHGRSMYRLTLECESGSDTDSDGFPDDCDNCVALANPEQNNDDNDFMGNACDDDDDNDWLPDVIDNCPTDPNPDQADADSDGIGDICDICPNDELNDPDNDNVCDGSDNCIGKYNPLQEDTDEDGIGDSCDNCIYVHNPDQLDDDEDNIGNLCESCCFGVTGNVDCSEIEEPDISDITRLIDFLYISHAELCCPDEADVDASGSDPDISDITYLIDHLYLSHKDLPECL